MITNNSDWSFETQDNAARIHPTANDRHLTTHHLPLYLNSPDTLSHTHHITIDCPTNSADHAVAVLVAVPVFLR